MLIKNLQIIFTFLFFSAFTPSFSKVVDDLQLRYEIAPIKNILSDLEIKILDSYNTDLKYIGREGTIYFITNFLDENNVFDPSDIEEKTKFVTKIIFENDNNEEYNISCRLWKPANDNLRLFCDLNENLTKYDTNYKINLTSAVIQYNEKTINITYNAEHIYIQQYNTSIPFLYSDKQEINIAEEKENYEVKFKYSKYNNEKIFLFIQILDLVLLDKCRILESKEIICEVTKEELEKMLVSNGQVFEVWYHNDITGGKKFENVLDIKINHYITEKEDIPVTIEKLKDNVSELYGFVTYETNIASINNFASYNFMLITEEQSSFCFMKKTEGKNLLFLCEVDLEGNFTLGEIKQEIKLDDIYFKYNFLIQPMKNYESFSVKGIGGMAFYRYPDILDFTKNDNLIIEILGKGLENIKGIKLNPDSEEDLQCEDKEDIKRCIISRNHFQRKQSGYYDTFHLNHLNTNSLFYELPTFKVILPYENEVIINIKDEENIYPIDVGSMNGVISYITNYNDNKYNIFDISDIEEKTKFEGEIVDQYTNKTFYASCRLWKPINDNIRIFCKLNNNLTSNVIYPALSKITFEYKEYNITIIYEAIYFYAYKIEGIIPFLYSDVQEINIEQDTDAYYLKFKADSYNNELIELVGTNYFEQLIIDNCEIKERELKCQINSKNIEKLLPFSGDSFYIGYLIDNYGEILSNTVLDIKINYKNLEKQDIFIDISKLLDKSGERLKYITYEANVKNMNDVISDDFKLIFNENYNASCFLKKSESLNLLILCKFSEDGEYHLKPTNEIIKFDNINIKYNFILNPIYNNETFTIIRDYRSNIFNIYPETLDFTKQDLIIVKFIASHNKFYMGNIKINPNGDNLKCDYDLINLVICQVPVSHFDYEENGYYNTYYTNYLGELCIYSEATPFKVILPQRKFVKLLIKEEDNKDPIQIGQNGTFYFITNYIDTENVFNPSDIEEKTLFKGKILESNGFVYYANCRLWKPIHDKLVIMCNLNDNFINNNQKIKLNKVDIEYDEYKIGIFSEAFVQINQLDNVIPFIYSSQQNINIIDNEEIYELKFKYDSYNNDILYIHGNQVNYVILEKCEVNEKELVYKLSKKEILKLLIYNGEKFTIGTLNDNIGKFEFSLVKDIIINYTVTEKKDINIYITNLLTSTCESGAVFAYNTTTVQTVGDLSSKLFTLSFKDKDIDSTQNCYFKYRL